ncbi:short neuropeptide F-like [Anthonomus grandis grandis]|uniref:short neuropeptide F-like n=1 Tax=Anthonomus grandis grandis TaxID=2921223 RepID=UPI0021655FAC|nr:short neuropeptide F-like [Anthonomus grandis grandis]XP_050294182.1 short neuropeptide F-like [Anthonomus grandis grandis]
MNITSTIRVFSAFVCLLLLVANVTSAPSYSSDYDAGLRGLVEMLFDRVRESNMEDNGIGYHTVSRKAGRSPQLRLRFGKRMDPNYPISSTYLSAINDISADN